MTPIEMQTYLVEYEFPPLRAVYQEELWATDERDALRVFLSWQDATNITCSIRKITEKKGDPE